ncbi:baseplate J/gp47 family protein [Candidatus Symbiopectobacterium sp.]|uniref:baseplate J/gp47 family protein n=1 Tax=Candidatus Symbiopectobacterium sp. TaxID=2816440 RepID=UPI0025BFF0D4|nr:baseplate J/gp47 family protein [Candidatus Symbiopectobacterium sp.]
MATIDVSQLPAPNVIAFLDFETLFAQRKDRLIALYPPDQREALRRTLRYESEPLVKLLQENTYRELLLRQRINEAAQANMLAYATGTDLDQLGANYNVQRLVITHAVKESDRDFRLRIQQAFEGLSVAGPSGAYQFHGRSANGRVADISVISPSPACITVSVLSREGDGTASAALIEKVVAALNADAVRPIADRVTVQSARIVPYEVEAVLHLLPGPEARPIRQAAEQRLDAYAHDQHRLGRDIRLSALYAALHVEGVQRVVLKRPEADIVLDATHASYCQRHTLTPGGSDA